MTTDAPHRANATPAEEIPGTGLDELGLPMEHDETSPGGRGRRRGVVIGACVAVALALGGSGVALGAWNTVQNEDHASALSEWREARDELGDTLDQAGTVLAVGETAGVDPDLLSALAGVIEAAGALDLVIAPELTRAGDISRAGQIVTTVSEHVETLTGATLDVQAAVTVVEVSAAVEEIVSAQAELDAGITQAHELLAASEGHVLDDAPRVALSEAIDAASSQHDISASIAGARDELAAAVKHLADGDADVVRSAAQGTLLLPDGETVLDATSLTEGAAALRERAAHLGAAQGPVVEAQAAWQAEQDRIAHEAAVAAEQARAAQRAAASSSSSSSAGSSNRARGTTGTGSRGASSSAAKTGSSTGTPSTGSRPSGGGATSGGSSSSGGDGSYWQDTSSGPNGCHAGDTAGNSWEC